MDRCMFCLFRMFDILNIPNSLNERLMNLVAIGNRMKTNLKTS